MKKIMLLVLISIFLVPTISLAFTSQEKEYINKIKELTSPDQKLPQPPAGYGIIRNNQTGDIVILLKGQNQGKIIGKTTYGGKIIAVYEKWVRYKSVQISIYLKINELERQNSNCFNISNSVSSNVFFSWEKWVANPNLLGIIFLVYNMVLNWLVK